jgi:hypothetical protein
MPIQFHFRPDAKLVISVHVGTVDDDEFIVSYKELFKSDRFDFSLNLLIDLRQADSSQRSTDALQQLAFLAQTTYQDSSAHPKVVVVAPKALSFGLARMAKAFSHRVPWDFAVFYSQDEALGWLGVPNDLLNDLNKGSDQ